MHKIWAIFRKDLLIEFRTKDSMTSMLFFGIVVLVIFNFALGSMHEAVRTAFPGGMETSSPVLGFLPMPVFLGLIVNTPNPRSSIRSSFFKADFIASKTESTASSAFVLEIPVRSTT